MGGKGKKKNVEIIILMESFTKSLNRKHYENIETVALDFIFFVSLNILEFGIQHLYF